MIFDLCTPFIPLCFKASRALGMSPLLAANAGTESQRPAVVWPERAESRVRVLQLRTGTVRTCGRAGQGPLEFTAVGRGVVPLPTHEGESHPRMHPRGSRNLRTGLERASETPLGGGEVTAIEMHVGQAAQGSGPRVTFGERGREPDRVGIVRSSLVEVARGAGNAATLSGAHGEHLGVAAGLPGQRVHHRARQCTLAMELGE